MSVMIEFTVYPFEEGETPPGYVRAAIGEFEDAGLHVDLGPLGQTVTGETEAVLEALRAAEQAAIGSGATRFVVSIQVVE